MNNASDYIPGLNRLNGKEEIKELSFKNLKESIDNISIDTAIFGTLNLGFSIMANGVVKVGANLPKSIKLFSKLGGKVILNYAVGGSFSWAAKLFYYQPYYNK